MLCTDHHLWSTGRIVQAFRGQWNVEELVPPGEKGRCGALGAVASVGRWIHTATHVATVLGLALVSLAKIALGTSQSALALMEDLAEIRATLVRTTTGGPGRGATVMIAPERSISQRRAVKTFELGPRPPEIVL